MISVTHVALPLDAPGIESMHPMCSDVSVPLSEIYCTCHVTDETRTAAGLLPLLVRPPGTLFRTLSVIRTPQKRGSMVRTSVCSWRTFPDLRLIHGWRVTTSWVRRPLWVNQLGQLSLPSLRGR